MIMDRVILLLQDVTVQTLLSDLIKPIAEKAL